jgi:glycosyltransferase involved in cell wall biosynthesis
MKVLLLAPQPFFEDRGTPIAVDLVLRVLSEKGHEVHVLTYHEGSDRSYPGITIHRIPRLPFIRNIRPGFSWKKVICDIFLSFQALYLLIAKRPHVVHALEETSLLAWFFRLVFRIPYVYDMDSSIADQLVEKHPSLARFLGIFRWFERRAVRGAEVVVPVCPALAEIARRYGPKQVVLLPDISLITDQFELSSASEELRGVPRVRFMYVGNLERYQGIDLVLEAISMGAGNGCRMYLAVIGGTGPLIDSYRKKCGALGIKDQVKFLGPKPVATLGTWLEQADVLLSPRTKGVNTPMKIYSYLDSGKPLLATRLPTHTQVLTDEFSCLANPDPRSWADAMTMLAEDKSERDRLGAAGKAFAKKYHSFNAFHTTLSTLYRELEDRIVTK